MKLLSLYKYHDNIPNRKSFISSTVDLACFLPLAPRPSHV